MPAEVGRSCRAIARRVVRSATITQFERIAASYKTSVSGRRDFSRSAVPNLLSGRQFGLLEIVAAIVTGLLFLLAMLAAPYAQLVPLAATAPVLILVGGLMMAPLVDIAWDDPEAAIPAFLTVAMIPLTFSIANGLAFGITAYALLKLVRGRITRTDRLLLVISALFVARFVWLSAD